MHQKYVIFCPRSLFMLAKQQPTNFERNEEQVEWYERSRNEMKMAKSVKNHTGERKTTLVNVLNSHSDSQRRWILVVGSP